MTPKGGCLELTGFNEFAKLYSIGEVQQETSDTSETVKEQARLSKSKLGF